MHRKATAPSLFPNLQLRHKDVTVATPIPKCKTFTNGESVLVYDKMTKLSTIGKVLSKISNTSYSVQLQGVTKHIAIDNMSKTVIKDNGDENVNDSASISDVDSGSDNDSVSNFSDVEELNGLQQQVGGRPLLQPAQAVPVRPGSPPTRQIHHQPHLHKKTRSGRKY